jgi:hypothetical protein
VLDRTPFRMTRHGKYLPRGHLPRAGPERSRDYHKVSRKGEWRGDDGAAGGECEKVGLAEVCAAG